MILGVFGLSFVVTACSAVGVSTDQPTAPATAPSSPLPETSDVVITPPIPSPPHVPRPDPSPTTYASGPEIIGYSVAGRPLTMYRYGGGPSRRLIVAGIHGGYEWNTIALAHQLMSHLLVHPEMVPPDVSLYVLPALNPDGHARSLSYAGRANENEVDLNRNWPSLWQPDWPKAGCWNFLPIHGGTAPASEPEVAALMDFIVDTGIEAIISYHSAALGIFPGGQPPLSESVDLAETVAEVAPYPYPPINAGCLYTGQFADWAAEVGISALDVELTNHRDTDLEINLRVLEAFLNWEPRFEQECMEAGEQESALLRNAGLIEERELQFQFCR
ncbi:MAG: M14 family metallopeptidase [Anaerolineales bacterium]